MKQKFKHKTQYTKTVVDRILGVYDRATYKDDWYQEANMFAQELAYRYVFIGGRTDSFKQSVAKVCGIIAALSPLKSWEENKRITITFLRDGKANHTPTFNKKAQDILDSDGQADTIATILNGNKITSFFLNILNPQTSQAVTIDRHAVSIALDEYVTDNYAMTQNQYNFFQNCYRVAAQMRGVRPLQMQAVTWVQWRIDKNVEQPQDFSDVPF